MYVERPLEISNEGFAERSIDLRRWGVANARFQELASRDYYLVDYTYIKDEDGTEAKRALSLIQEGISPTDPTNNKVQIKEYEDAAANYKADLHGYFPLPLSEVLNNQETSN